MRATNASHRRARMTTTPLDLVRDLKAALDGPLDLFTTSALLDLVSEAWLERLAIEVACAGFCPMQRYLTTAGSPLSLPMLSMRRSSRPLATTNVVTSDWTSTRPGCREASNRDVRSRELFCRERRGRLGDEAHDRGHAGGLVDGAGP